MKTNEMAFVGYQRLPELTKYKLHAAKNKDRKFGLTLLWVHTKFNLNKVSNNGASVIKLT